MTDETERALQAERLLNDPLVKDAFREVENGLVAALKHSPVGDVDTHHNLALSLQLLANVERQFRNWIATGQLEVQRERDRKRFRMFGS